MQSRNIHGVIFDLDGTLINSIIYIPFSGVSGPFLQHKDSKFPKQG
ncbi:MAG TPA: hypothetical protein HA254_02380 [Candidatus Diapherotrites archaeon]|uniref:Uncharacterized protein n=1 Tax=Candidatus Iainarchaeum sp. TaxID=3101447 RepID=A0A7J4IXD3_9ARCH|nr:hypothetical protein [Candidatus Diapherotrites archaeon]